MIEVDESMSYSKYYRFGENALTCLINNKIWMAHPRSFNDPFDSRVELPPDFRREVEVEINRQLDTQLAGHEHASRRTLIRKGLKNYTDPLDIRRLLKSNGVELNANLSKSVQLLYLIEEAYSKVGICSFARPKGNPDQRLMWAHYGDSHRGLCIDYKFSKKKIEDQRLNACNVIGNHSPVAFPIDEFKANPDRQKIFEWVMERIRVKDHIWQYEQEFRLSGVFANQLVDTPGEIVEITFGLKMHPTHRETISTLVQRIPHLQGVVLREVTETYGSFDHGERDLKPPAP